MSDLTVEELEAMAAKLEAGAEVIRGLGREHDARLMEAAAAGDILAVRVCEGEARDLARRRRVMANAAAALRMVVEVAAAGVDRLDDTQEER